MIAKAYIIRIRRLKLYIESPWDKGGENMLIHVVRSDNRYDYVKDFVLDNLIESKGIVKFKRRTGWVTVGVDPIRRSKRDSVFRDPDRRAVKIQ
jgi:hypothetical protein